jgi:XisI protein
MDRINTYRDIIRNTLNSYLNISYANNPNIHNRAAFDSKNDQYLIISEGWDSKKHIHSCLIHIEIINGKVWIQCDNTESGVAVELVPAGIPKEDIVLGFHEPNVRQYTGFAVA